MTILHRPRRARKAPAKPDSAQGARPTDAEIDALLAGCACTRCRGPLDHHAHRLFRESASGRRLLAGAICGGCFFELLLMPREVLR